MPLIEELHDSLPYIDPDLSAKERGQIDKFISAELSLATNTDILHPSIPSAPDFKLSELMTLELERRAAGLPMTSSGGGIDLSRYEAPEPPSDENDMAAWKSTLQRAYTSTTYLTGRTSNLSLLEEEPGKNAWLIGNSQLEDILRQMEKELDEVKVATEEVNKSRKAAQEESRAELMALEETWKAGIGRVLEAEVAVEELRQQVLKKRRQQGGMN